MSFNDRIELIVNCSDVSLQLFAHSVRKTRQLGKNKNYMYNVHKKLSRRKICQIDFLMI